MGAPRGGFCFPPSSPSGPAGPPHRARAGSPGGNDLIGSWSHSLASRFVSRVLLSSLAVIRNDGPPGPNGPLSSIVRAATNPLVKHPGWNFFLSRRRACLVGLHYPASHARRGPLWRLSTLVDTAWERVCAVRFVEEFRVFSAAIWAQRAWARPVLAVFPGRTLGLGRLDHQGFRGRFKGNRTVGRGI